VATILYIYFSENGAKKSLKKKFVCLCVCVCVCVCVFFFLFSFSGNRKFSKLGNLLPKKSLLVSRNYFNSILWCSHTGNYPWEDFARFGYKTERKLKVFVLSYFLFSYPQRLNMANSTFSPLPFWRIWAMCFFPWQMLCIAVTFFFNFWPCLPSQGYYV